MLERALPVFEKHYGPGHPKVAIIQVNLGITYGALGGHKKKKELLERALPIFKKNCPDLFQSCSELLAELDEV